MPRRAQVVALLLSGVAPAIVPTPSLGQDKAAELPASSTLTADMCEETGAHRMCLLYDDIDGIVPLANSVVLFVTPDNLYINRTLSKCRPSKAEGVRYYFNSEGRANVCRNDRLYMVGPTGGTAPFRVCTLGEFKGAKRRLMPPGQGAGFENSPERAPGDDG